MKHSLSLILLLFSSFIVRANVRDSIPDGVPLNYPKGWVRYSQQVMADRGFATLFIDTTARPKYPMIGITTYDSSIWWWNNVKWQRVAAPAGLYVKYSDSTIIFITPTQLADSLNNYVTLNTFQVVPADKTWSGVHEFDNKVGIGIVPTRPLEILSGTGKMYFDGTRLGLYDSVDLLNVLIGIQTGQSLTSSNKNNVAVGGNALRVATGDYNLAVGNSALRRVQGNFNSGVGYQALELTDSSHNTALGYFAGVANYGKQNISIGSLSGNFVLIDSDHIANTEIVAGTARMSGTGVAAFISDNSLTVGQKYPFLLTFLGTPPSNYTSQNPVYTDGIITNSNTITFSNFTAFASQGTDSTNVQVYNLQNNAIAIGYNVNTDSSNQIKIGNVGNSVLKANRAVFDIITVPQNGDTYIYNSSLGKFEPSASSVIPERVVRMTTTQRDAIVTPTPGMIIFNTTDGVGQMYDGSIWNDLW